MKKIFDFTNKKTILQAIFFYIISFLVSLIAAGLAGGLMGLIGEVGMAATGGVAGATIFIIYISYRIYSQSNLSVINNLFLISGIIITFLYGSIFGLLPIAIATCFNRTKNLEDFKINKKIITQDNSKYMPKVKDQKIDSKNAELSGISRYYSDKNIEETIEAQEKVKTKDVKLYHDNGKLRTLATLDEDEKPHGNCKEWYPSGNIFKNQNFKHGTPHGSFKEYFENGNLWKEYNFINGKEHGKNNQFYEDGKKDIVGNFINGKMHGLKEQYFSSGNLETRTTYENGLIEGLHIFLSKDGEVIEEKIMQKGLDITMELFMLMAENNSEHMIKAGLIKDGVQKYEPGEFSQKMYEYYKANNLKVESNQVTALNEMLKEGSIDKDFYDMSMSALGQNNNKNS